MKDLFLAMWAYRQFIVSSVRNDLHSRFARSKLGALWMILQPLAQSAIYALVLSKVLAAKLPGTDNAYAYPIYLMSGVLAWSLFSELLTRSMTVFVDNANLLKKIVFPRICLPMVVCLSTLLNNLILAALTCVVFALLGHFLTFELLWLPVLMALTVALALGLGLFLGVLNVFLRDIAQVMGIVMQIWFWMTPIVYMPDIVSGPFRSVIEANPLFPLVTAYQQVLLYGKAPDWGGLVGVAALATVLLVLALATFRRASPDMVDVL